MRERGMGEQQAIATAVNGIKEWARGRAWGGKVKVTPQVQQAAQRTIAEWERLRAAHHKSGDNPWLKCLTCGCHRPDDDHGDPRHITLRDLQDAAEAAGETTAEAVSNIVDTLRPMPVTGNPWLTAGAES